LNQFWKISFTKTRSWSESRSVYVPQSKPISNLSWVMQKVSAFRLVASRWTYARVRSTLTPQKQGVLKLKCSPPSDQSLKDASGGGPTDDDGAGAVLLGTGTSDVTGERTIIVR
jgi:hypothetical protein